MRKKTIRISGYCCVLTILSLLISCSPKKDIDDARLFFEENYGDLVQMNGVAETAEGFYMVHSRVYEHNVKKMGLDDQKNYLWLSYKLKELNLVRIYFLNIEKRREYSGNYVEYVYAISGLFDRNAYSIQIVYVTSEELLNSTILNIKGEVIPLSKPGWYVLYNTEF